MKKPLRTLIATAILAFILSISSCDAFGYGLFTKLDVTDVTYAYTWVYYGVYYAHITYKATNTGLVDMNTGDLTFKVTCGDGMTYTDDCGLPSALAVGDSMDGFIDIQTDGQTNGVTAQVTDIKRYAPVGTIGG